MSSTLGSRLRRSESRAGLLGLALGFGAAVIAFATTLRNAPGNRQPKGEPVLVLGYDELINILEALPDCAYIVDEDLNVTYANPAMQAKFGVPSSKCYEYTHARKDPCPDCPDRYGSQDGVIRNEWMSPDGSTYDVASLPLHLPQGSSARLHILRDPAATKEMEQRIQEAHDHLEARFRERTEELERANHALQAEIRERERTEELLREAEARFRVALKSGQIIVAHIDRDLRYTWIYDARSEQSSERFLGKRDDEILPPEDVAEMVAFKQGVVETGEPARREITIRRPDGPRIYDVVAEPLRDSKGEVIGATTAALDITERRQAEMALVHADRLALTGKMAALLIHEIKNPLQSIMGCMALAREAMASGADATRYFEVASEELQRVNRLVSQLRDLHKAPAAEKREPTDINEIVSKVVSLIEKEASDRQVRITTELEESLPTVTVGRGQMQQVFLNLALNALDAMPQGGNLTISTHNGTSPAGVCIAFSDTGVGMSSEVAQHMFEDFYSTKKSGLGLGLFISNSIVKQHGGRIELETEEGKGTTFTVWIPRYSLA